MSSIFITQKQINHLFRKVRIAEKAIDTLCQMHNIEKKDLKLIDTFDLSEDVQRLGMTKKQVGYLFAKTRENEENLIDLLNISNVHIKSDDKEEIEDNPKVGLTKEQMEYLFDKIKEQHDNIETITSALNEIDSEESPDSDIEEDENEETTVNIEPIEQQTSSCKSSLLMILILAELVSVGVLTYLQLKK